MDEDSESERWRKLVFGHQQYERDVGRRAGQGELRVRWWEAEAEVGKVSRRSGQAVGVANG